MPSDQPNDFRMPLGDHLEELRARLIHALIGSALALALTFYFGTNIIYWLAQPLMQARLVVGLPPQPITLDPSAGFTSVYLPVSLIAALIIASPWIVFQIWTFIATGLYDYERRVVYILAPFSTIMTVLGVLFTYHILLPVCLMFFLMWSMQYPTFEATEPGWVIQRYAELSGLEDQPDVQLSDPATELVFPTYEADPVEPKQGQIWINATDGQIRAHYNGQTRVFLETSSRMMTPMHDLGRFVKFAAMMGLGVVIAFQLPVIMLVLGWSGLIDPTWLTSLRRYALLIAIITGAILTPTDIVSMFVLAIPLYALYEFGLVLMKLVYKAPEEET